MDISTLPFNREIGLQVRGGTVVLQPRPNHLNHLDTVHATVIYGVAEAAAGHCLVREFPELSGSSTAVLRTATVKYRRPASGSDELVGSGDLPAADAHSFRDALNARRRAMLDVRVSVIQADSEVFCGSFCWFVSLI